MNSKVILIGAINEGNTPTCGETMKNQLFVRRFGELFDKVITVDTLNWQRRPWVLIKLFLTLLFNRKAKVVISASGASAYLIKFLYHIPLKKNVYFWVVGGNLTESVKAGRYHIKALASLKYILVQGQSMVTSLNALGLTNVKHVPNSKPITFEPAIEPKAEDAAYRFVFLSRVHPQKGIKEICEAATMLNNDGLSNRFSVDFYGKIEASYEGEFMSLVQSTPNLTYKGFLNLTNNDGYQTLSGYDVMLFPTYWGGEGFPGIVIDANMAGLPIIASDWNMNREVIEDGKTGFIIPVHDSKALADYMKKFINNEIALLPMRKNCVEYVMQYDYRNVISRHLFSEIGLLK